MIMEQNLWECIGPYGLYGPIIWVRAHTMDPRAHMGALAMDGPGPGQRS